MIGDMHKNKYNAVVNFKDGHSEIFVVKEIPNMSGYNPDTIIQIEESNGDVHLFNMQDIKDLHFKTIKQDD